MVRQMEVSSGAPGYPPPAPPPQAGGSPPRSPQNAPAAKTPNPSSASTAGTKGARPSAGKGEAGKGSQTAPKSAWGPPVNYTPAPASFAPRAPQKKVAMTEDFENSGWKEKTLWSPPEEEARGNRQGRSGASAGTVTSSIAMTPPQAPSAAPCSEGAAAPRHSKVSMSSGSITVSGGSGSAAGPRSKLRADGAEQSKMAETTQHEAPASGGSEALKPPKAKEASKQVKDPLEVLDPESSDESGGSDMEEGPPPEYAVLDMTVPRTALVLNVSHVLKRLNGCCSLNQLTKAMTNFKEKCGLSLEAFLRANPMSFLLDGRIVYLLDRDGEKWVPPPQQQQQGDATVVGSQAERGKGGAQAARGGKGGAQAERPKSNGQVGESSGPQGASHAKGGKGSKGDAGSNGTKGAAKQSRAAESTKGGDKVGSRGGKGSKGSSKGGSKGKAGRRAQHDDWDEDAHWDSYGWDDWSGEGHWDSHGWDEWGESDWKVGGWKGSW